MRPRYSFSSKHTRRVKNIRKQREKFPALAEKVIEDSDIILEILDARFVEETRNISLEEIIKKQKKKLIYVINKIDLIEKNKVKIGKLKPFAMISAKDRNGSKILRDLIKIESKKIDSDRVIIGVIGYPNTGKSSIINLLIGKGSAKTGAEAGFTKGIQKLKLSPGVLLLDSPGVIPTEEYSNIEQSKITKQTKIGARTEGKIREPEMFIADLIKEYPGVLEKKYNLKIKGDSEKLLEKLGREKGFLKKGNKVNEDQTARFIIGEWQTGKIKI